MKNRVKLNTWEAENQRFENQKFILQTEKHLSWTRKSTKETSIAENWKMRLLSLYLLSQISAQEFFSSHEALKRLEIKESFMLKEFQAGLEKKLEEVSSLLSDLSEIKDDRGENIDHPLDQFKVRFYY